MPIISNLDKTFFKVSFIDFFSFTSFGNKKYPKHIETKTTGIFTRNIACHPPKSNNNPPSVGPNPAVVEAKMVRTANAEDCLSFILFCIRATPDGYRVLVPIA